MNRTVSILFAVAFGVVVGFFAARQYGGGQKVTPSPVLDDLTFAKFMEPVVSSDWHIVEDKNYDSLPQLSRNPAVGHRIVAQTTLENSNQAEFATRFQQAAENWITSHGAVIKGQQDANHSVVEAMDGGQAATLIDLPRRFYAIGDNHGIADFGCIVNSGQVTVVISLIEGH